MKIYIEDGSRQKNEKINIICDTQKECDLLLDMLSYVKTLPSIDEIFYMLTESKNRLDKLIKRIGKSRV